MRQHLLMVEVANRRQATKLVEERPEGRLHPRVILRGDHVHGDALQRRDQDAPLGHVRGQLCAIEVAEPRPETEVRPGRVLRLQAGEQADRVDGGEVCALEEQLARERRPVQFARGQGQTTILPNLFPARKRS